ncbi:hypothetical protein CCHOA_04395 [Corynebacterium choanae]|uniref:Uncharacterized protein n=1 Tax=Corynebacterium choanae TaxID=1862358 RepID=A0A3G6J8S2_9CORY|nr:hypothetical protein CCHOA_04395 [Corynebacterium choanae]
MAPLTSSLHPEATGCTPCSVLQKSHPSHREHESVEDTSVGQHLVSERIILCSDRLAALCEFPPRPLPAIESLRTSIMVVGGA